MISVGCMCCITDPRRRHRTCIRASQEDTTAGIGAERYPGVIPGVVANISLMIEAANKTTIRQQGYGEGELIET